MTTYTEGKTPGDWLIYEAAGTYSRSACTVAGGDYGSGTVMGQVTATKKFKDWDPTANDGSETVAGILLNPVKAAAADATGVVIDTHAQISRLGLSFGAGVTTSGHRDTAITQLRALGIKNV
ncbi:head decoration protein [Pseudophaeobacter sp.]|uniref:head decoration protein n=1 Tax=Pseudophaeobacter sp. TaxID=1971739 RepID=UPI00326652CF